MEDSSPRPPALSPEGSLERLLAGLAWLWVLSAVILLVKKDSPFVQFHARQGFLLFLVSLLVWILLSLLGGVAIALRQLWNLFVFLLMVVGFLQAVRGRWWVLPVLGPLAPKVHL